MKIAIVLTGHMRCWKQVFPNFKSKFLDGFDADVFIHTWNEEGWWIPGDKQNVKGFYEGTPQVFADEIANVYNPKKIVVEDWSNFNLLFEERGNQFANFAHRRKNILSMFYKLHQGVSLMENYMAETGTKYDFVFRMRPDLIFNGELPSFESNSFYTITHRNHMGKGTGDMFQAGNPFSVILFSKLSCFIDEMYRQTDILCPHMLSEAWIKTMGLNWKEVFINKTIQHTPEGEYKEVSL